MNTAQELYAKTPDDFYTGEVVDGEEVVRPATWDEISEARREEFEASANDPWSDLSGKSPEQINNLIHALAPVIDIYSKNVMDAEERCQRERKFLADTMALYLRLTHATARRAAEALEQTALAAGARSDETNEDSAQSEGRQSGGEAVTPTPDRSTQSDGRG